MSEFSNDGIYSEELADTQGVATYDSLLDSLGLELIEDNIIQQIRHDTSSTMDFLSMVTTKFTIILNSDEVESEDKSQLLTEVIDFCGELIGYIADEYNLHVDITTEAYNVYMTTLTILYNFFILDKNSNVEKFILGYIEANKDVLIESLGLDERTKDITSLSNKKKNIDKSDIYILSGINDIIEFIKNSNIIEPDDFLEIIDDGEINTSNLIGLINEGTIGGNFVPALLASVLGEVYDNNEATRIRNSIRSTFYIKNVDNELEE